ncbi:MAG: alpha/beta fold hydrolase [Candidatus Omnitrophota bacterium]
MAVKFCFRLPRQSSSPVLTNGLEYKAEPSQATVLLIHGLTGTTNEMKGLANFFYRRGYSVLCPRLAHHGEPLHILKRAKWQEFYRSVKEALSKIPSDQKVFTAGLSMGALLALLLAEEFPERISGVTGLSPTLFYDGWNIPWSHCLLPLAYYTPIRYFAYFKEEPPYGIKNERIRSRVHEYYKNASLADVSEAAQYGYPYFPVTLLCELHLLIRELMKKMSRITAPVQLIQASEDDMTSVRNSQFIYDHVASTRKEIVLLHDSYHVITADQERRTVAQKMNEFFCRIQGVQPGEALNGKEEEEREEDACRPA